MPGPRRTANRYPEKADAIRAVIGEYALRDGIGRVQICQPRAVELALYPQGSPGWTGNDGKVCYPGEAQARNAAALIGQIPGADRVEAYPCPRGGHWHLVDQQRRRCEHEARVCRIALAAARARQRDAA